jgi:MFS transporter, DHA2 family, multidrug resistance protein
METIKSGLAMLVTTSWQNRTIVAHAKLANVVDPTRQLTGSFPPGTTGQMVREMFNNLVTSQSLMLATNGLMMLIAAIYVAASIAIVLAPKAARTVDPPRWGFAVAHEGI